MKYRMYSFVLRQLNPMQKGIQTAHAIVEYETLYGKTNAYKKWANVDKTLIVLDGGTHPELIEILETLEKEGVRHDYFTEPDLADLVTSVVVIADERVWDKKTYPDYDPAPTSPAYDEDGNIVRLAIHMTPEPYEDWVERMGGQANVKLRELIFSKRLAQ